MKNHASRSREVAVHVLLPVAVGALIYISWRATSLLLFQLVIVVGLPDQVMWWREIAAVARRDIPCWLLFSVPDALWVYALTAAMTILWRHKRNPYGSLWIAMEPALGCGAEAAQAFKFVPGTYDHMDLVMSLGAALVVWSRECRIKRTREA